MAARKAREDAVKVLDILIDTATEGIGHAAAAAQERPADEEVQAVFTDTALRLDLLLRLREGLRAHR